MNLLTPHWEHPACVRCAHCHEPIEHRPQPLPCRLLQDTREGDRQMRDRRKLWLDTRGVPVITTAVNGERNAERWGWTPATAVPTEEEKEMSTTQPTTAREALDLAWELAHPVKEGHEVPTGTELIAKVRDGEFLTYRSLKPLDGVSRPGWAEARTLDPLPDLEPDWLDAPAVMARGNDWVSCADPQVFVRENKDGTRWVCDTRFYRWDELTDVTPLWPKEQDA